MKSMLIESTESASVEANDRASRPMLLRTDEGGGRHTRMAILVTFLAVSAGACAAGAGDDETPAVETSTVRPAASVSREDAARMCYANCSAQYQSCVIGKTPQQMAACTNAYGICITACSVSSGSTIL
jgi:hypothetical protein